MKWDDFPPGFIEKIKSESDIEEPAT